MTIKLTASHFTAVAEFNNNFSKITVKLYQKRSDLLLALLTNEELAKKISALQFPVRHLTYNIKWRSISNFTRHDFSNKVKRAVNSWGIDQQQVDMILMMPTNIHVYTNKYGTYDHFYDTQVSQSFQDYVTGLADNLLKALPNITDNSDLQISKDYLENDLENLSTIDLLNEMDQNILSKFLIFVDKDSISECIKKMLDNVYNAYLDVGDQSMFDDFGALGLAVEAE